MLKFLVTGAVLFGALNVASAKSIPVKKVFDGLTASCATAGDVGRFAISISHVDVNTTTMGLSISLDKKNLYCTQNGWKEISDAEYGLFKAYDFDKNLFWVQRTKVELVVVTEELQLAQVVNISDVGSKNVAIDIRAADLLTEKQRGDLKRVGKTQLALDIFERSTNVIIPDGKSQAVSEYDTRTGSVRFVLDISEE